MHSKEPWKNENRAWTNELRSFNILDAEGRWVAQANSRESQETITSCVNALAGMNPSKLGKFIEAAEWLRTNGVFKSHGSIMLSESHMDRCPVCQFDRALRELRGGK